MAYRLAIVEDEAIVAHNIEQKLVKLGYEVSGIFYRAEMLFSFLESGGTVDLILMDIQLQNSMRGIDAAAKVLSRYRIPVVYLTAFSDDATLGEAMKTEPYGYLIKPFNDRELKATVEMALYKAEVVRELMYRQARWEAIFSHLRDGLLVTDALGRIGSVNGAMEKLTGLDASFLVGKSIDEVFSFFQQAGRKENYVLLEVKKNGRRVPVYWDSSVMMNTYGEKLGTVYICHDVSEILEYERELEKSEENYRTLIENQKDWVVKIGEDGSLFYVNDAMAVAFDVEKQQLIGQSFFDVIPKEEKDEWKKFITSLQESEEVFSREMTFFRQGVRYVIEWRFSCIQPGVNGRACKEIQGVGRDITLLREMEEAFREEDEFLKRILMAIEEGVVIVNEEGKIEFVNPRGREMLGLTKDQTLGFLEVVKIFRHNGDIVEDFSSLLQQILLHPSGVWVLTNRYQRRYEVMIDVSTLKREDKGKTEFVFLLTDLTLFNQLQQEFYRAQRLQSMEVLAGGIAHDFNNILTVIMGNLSLVRMRFGEGIPELSSYVTEAEEACERARQLTQQMLSFSRQGTPAIRQENIVQIIEDTTKFVLQGSAIRWRLERKTDFVSIPIDGGQLSQVIHNLVLNAREAMKERGEIVITLDKISADQVHARVQEPLSEVREYFSVTIQDNGPGIPAEILPKIFDPYVSTKARGSGLGLVIVYTIIRNHHGLVDVTSEEGKGTAFRIYLPLYSVEETQKVQIRSVYRKTQVLVKGKRAWILDDEVGIVRVLDKSLRQNGYEVFSFQSVGDFLQRIDELSSEDIIIMDITLPGEMPVEERLQRVFACVPDAKVVLISGYTKHPLSFPADKQIFFLTKPFTVPDLLLFLQRVLYGEKEGKEKET